MTEISPAKKSDLPVRVASAMVMVAVAGTALWLGGWVWAVFVALVAVGVFWEWMRLAFAISAKTGPRILWGVAGLLYVGLAAAVLLTLRGPYDGIFNVGQVLLAVIGVDVGAYFAGRAIGGPKIAPSISPSKTWAGLLGGMVGGSILLSSISWAWPAGLCQTYVDFTEITDAAQAQNTFSFDSRCHLWVPDWSVAWQFIMVGTVIAIVAQAGDFFESWMKRKAGVKDSSNLIPGHGGLYDRADGMLAVCFVGGLIMLAVSQFPL